MTGPFERAVGRALQNEPTAGDKAFNGTTFPTLPPAEVPAAQPTPSKRRKRRVNTLAQRDTATIWMVEEAERAGPKHIISKCVKQFPQFFTGNEKANLQKASRWWKMRPPPAPPVQSPSKRRKHHVNTLGQRYAATIWMLEEAERTGPKHIISKCVKQFPQFFSGNDKANLQKASRWWKMRHETLKLEKTEQRPTSLTSTATDGISRAKFKCMPGRGRKRAPWVSALYKDLLLEFERLQSDGLKVTSSVLRDHALLLIDEAPSNCAYNKSAVHKGKPVADYISIRWVQHFMNCERIDLRSEIGANG